ncbi:MAG TPA: hypothetical protein VGV10_03365 [Thermoleophilaceae bacterium]|nr:hypothetical protein [Thermoleophilaceae bacterium]
MTLTGQKRVSKARLLIAVVLASGGVGCGEDFENERRSPVPLELTGVIQPRGVTVSPAEVGAGPISITISNQTDLAHTVTLEGDSVREEVGPINPQDTATIQKTVTQGTYEVRANPDRPGGGRIMPGELRVGPPREASNERLLLP